MNINLMGTKQIEEFMIEKMRERFVHWLVTFFRIRESNVFHAYGHPCKVDYVLGT